MLPQSAAEHYQAMQRRVIAALALTRSAWSRMAFDDLDGSFEKILPVLTYVLTHAQLGAAREAVAYVPKVLAELGIGVAPVATVVPRSLAGVASDGRSLSGLLTGAKIAVKEYQSLESGGSWLDMATQTVVQDANRQAVGMMIAGHPTVGYVRAANPPCCQRCAVLAGRYYKYNQGFQRHPRCDCQNIPCTDSLHDGLVADIRPDEIKDLTRAQRQAIKDGADMNQVINSHRAGSRQGKLTIEGTTRRGHYSKVYRRSTRGGREYADVSQSGVRRTVTRPPGRLTPEAIYKMSHSREEAVRRLIQNGYMVDRKI